MTAPLVGFTLNPFREYISTIDRPHIIREYPLAFSRHPWHENITEEEAAGVIDGFEGKPLTSIPVAEVDGRFAGFAIGCPLSRHQGVAREVRKKYSEIDPDLALYLAEVVVLEPYQGLGLADKLVGWRIDAFARASGQSEFLVTVRLSKTANPVNYTHRGLRPCAEMSVLSRKLLPEWKEPLEVPDQRVVLAGMVRV